MNRVELEGLDREALIARAETAGVTRARILTRPELVDELLLRSATDTASKQRTRGFFGKARDLLASVVERGLNLPDAADRIRSATGPVPPSNRASAPAALPTVTLAEIYATQGHRGRAVETLERVLTREPEHAVARSLLAQLRDESYPVPPPRMPPELDEDADGAGDGHDGAASGEPTHMLDDAPLPTRYDVDECVAIPVDPTTLYVYWEVRERTLEYIRSMRPAGTIAMRVVIVVPTWDGPRSTVYDVDIHSTQGDYFARNLPAGCVVRVAVGYRHGDSFVAIAHSPALETPPGAPSPLFGDVLVRWTPNGTSLVSPADRDAAAIDRALGRVRREAAADASATWRGAFPERLGGASEPWARGPNAPSSSSPHRY